MRRRGCSDAILKQAACGARHSGRGRTKPTEGGGGRESLHLPLPCGGQCARQGGQPPLEAPLQPRCRLSAALQSESRQATGLYHLLHHTLRHPSHTSIMDRIDPSTLRPDLHAGAHAKLWSNPHNFILNPNAKSFQRYQICQAEFWRNQDMFDEILQPNKHGVYNLNISQRREA